MTSYTGAFFGSMVVFLLINLGCSSKDNKNLSDSDFKRNIFGKYKPKGSIEIDFNHKNISSGTCSKYKIKNKTNLQDKLVNEKLKLIDPEKHFYIERKNQEVCASTGKLTLPNSRAAPMGSRALIVFEDVENTAFDEIEVGTTVPTNIIYINNLLLSQDLLSQDKNLEKHDFQYVALGDYSEVFKISVIRKLNANTEYLNSVDEISLVATDVNGKGITLPINIIANTTIPLFYFKIPSEFSFGRYAMRLFVKNTPNVEQLFTIDVVEKYKEIDILFDNFIVDEVSIPIGTCKSYKLNAKDFNKKTYSIHSIYKNKFQTKLTTVENAKFNMFSTNDKDLKVCAYVTNTDGTINYPEIDQKATFTVKYENIESHVIVIAGENPKDTL
jgi:hypothetical protein